MKLMVANNAAPFVRGGAELLADRLVLELRAAGHEAELLRLPLGSTPETIVDGMIAAATMDVVNVDRVIGLKFPAYLIPHRDVVIWLVHQFRQVYDLAPTSGGWGDDPSLDSVGELIRTADRGAFARARRLYAISPIVADRLDRHNGIRAEVLLTPPHAELTYRCEPAADYFVALGRISDGKRQSLAALAMQYAQSGCRLVIAGAPDSPQALRNLQQAISRSGAGDRIELIPRFIEDEEKVELLARSIGSVYMPIDEDSYGYVCYEAAMSAKPSITCADSGGTLSLVSDGESGYVVPPDPRAVARAFDLLAADPPMSARMGRSAKSMAMGLDLSWSRVVRELTR